jgi:hypothetical protein
MLFPEHAHCLNKNLIGIFLRSIASRPRQMFQGRFRLLPAVLPPLNKFFVKAMPGKAGAARAQQDVSVLRFQPL